MSAVTERYVIDTSALFAYTDNEDGADAIEALLRQAQRGQVELLTSFASWMEIYYINLHEQGREYAESLIAKLKRLPLVRVESDEITGQTAGNLKSAHRLSFADAWIAALAVRQNAVLVHKDPEFEPLSQSIALLALPYR